MVALAGALPALLIADPATSRPVALAAAAVAAWLTELVPPFVPTLLLFGLAPLWVPGLRVAQILGWAADPILLLFFGGFALGAAARSTGLDQRLAEQVLRLSRGSTRGLIVATAAGGFVTSMWMSGGAAAAVLLAALRPLLTARSVLRDSLLLAVAVGTDFGGLVTPIGAGPNALAIAAMPPDQPLSFLRWMALAFPLAAILVAGATTAIVLRYRGPARWTEPLAPTRPLTGRQRALVLVFGCTVVAWLGEPLHGVPTAGVAVLMAAALFTSGLLRTDELGLIDWPTLLLIAGGLVVGRLLEHAGVITLVARSLPLDAWPPLVRSLVIVGLAATLSALMSNTATASLLVPLAAGLDPSPALPVLIALGCGLGIPFAISTPPNALAVGAGLPPRALAELGLPVMLAGVLLLAGTGALVLRLFGIG